MQRADRLIAAAGALALTIGTATAAMSAHVGDAADATRLDSASRMLLIHGLGLIALVIAGNAWPSIERCMKWVAAALALGLVLFAGSLLLAVVADAPTALAPIGGMLIILSWLATAVIVLMPRTNAGSRDA